jgi:hypothetical protein
LSNIHPVIAISNDRFFHSVDKLVIAECRIHVHHVIFINLRAFANPSKLFFTDIACGNVPPVVPFVLVSCTVTSTSATPGL